MFKDRIAEIDNLKQEIDSYRPIPAPILPMLKEYFRIGLTYSSNALEGNTLTETETKVILEDGLTIGGKTLKEHFEVLGHSKAYDFMLKQVHNNTLTEQDVRELHRLFYNLIDEENAGKYRKVPIFVTGTDFEFSKPSEVPILMKKFMEEIPLYQERYHPVHYAALVHAQLVTIHPFVDGPPPLFPVLEPRRTEKLRRTAPAEALAKAGNGRTARLLMNLALLQSGYVITIIPPIMRSTYISTIRQANKGNVTPFLEFISEMVYESSKEYLRLIRSMKDE
jgi:Fic family protein